MAAVVSIKTRVKIEAIHYASIILDTMIDKYIYITHHLQQGGNADTKKEASKNALCNIL